MNQIFQTNSTKANIEKIARTVINPVQALWGYEVDEYTAKAYLEELYFFSDEELNKAIKTLRKESEKRPSLSKIVKACYAARESSKPPSHLSAAPQSLTQKQIDEVMEGIIGINAFKGGYWWQLHEFLTYRATKTFITDDQIQAIKDVAAKAWSDQVLAEKVANSAPAFQPSFVNILETLMNRKRAVLYRYGMQA